MLLKKLKIMKKETWKQIFQIVLTILTALGTTLGVVNPAYVAVNDGPERSRIGNGEAFQKQRDVFRRRFRELQRSQLTQGGHGRKHKTKATETLRGKERNWVQTENHRISREIVNLASRWKVECIQMESLKGYGENQGDSAAVARL